MSDNPFFDSKKRVFCCLLVDVVFVNIVHLLTII